MKYAMPTHVIASQWPPFLNEQIDARLNGAARVVALDGGLGDPILRQARVLLAAPESAMPATPPEGWPFALDWVQLISSGTDHYPGWLLERSSNHPRVSTGKGTSASPMAEFALAAIFAHAKRLPEIWIGDSSRWGFTSLDSVSGATLGIAGFGVLGQAVARRAMAVGMKVIALRHRLTRSPVEGVELVETLEQLAARSDHLVLLLPANASTHRIVDARLLAAAKPGLHLINLGRGTLVDQQALLAALDAGLIARATLDVTDPEPLPDGHPLYRHPRVRISPHTSVFSSATFGALIERVLCNAARLDSGEALDGEI